MSPSQAGACFFVAPTCGQTDPLPPAQIAAAKKPWRVRSLSLGVKGGGAAFDRIVLGRTEKDLEK